jgi:hypothetical protein
MFLVIAWITLEGKNRAVAARDQIFDCTVTLRVQTWFAGGSGIGSDGCVHTSRFHMRGGGEHEAQINLCIRSAVEAEFLQVHQVRFRSQRLADCSQAPDAAALASIIASQPH